MVAGHLREKRGYYYIVLSYKDINGKRQTPSKSTGLPVKGNKKRAEAMLREAQLRKEQELELERQQLPCTETQEPLFSQKDVGFTDYMSKWLAMMQSNVEETTFSSYSTCVKKRINPYFDHFFPGIKLREITSAHIQEFYIYERTERKLSNNTILRRHANIRKALQYALRVGLIPSNPAVLVERPKPGGYKAAFCNEEELRTVIAAVKGDPVEFAVITAAFYGLRRSEIVGLKWDAINFQKKTITIRHVVTQTMVEGKHTVIQKDRTKNKTSHRSLPLVAPFEALLLDMKRQQKENQILCGNCYNTDYLDYIYVDPIGNLIKPDYITGHFQLVLKKNGLRRIRFHDLRHSCASLLLAHGVNLKQIQEWLGHSNIATTGDIYAHLDVESKVASAEAIVELLPAARLPENRKTAANQN